MGRRFKPGDPVFWLAFQPKLQGIYTYIREDKYPILTLKKGDRDYSVSIEAVFSLKEVETIINNPDLDQYFTTDFEIQKRDNQINFLKKLLSRKKKKIIRHRKKL